MLAALEGRGPGFEPRPLGRSDECGPEMAGYAGVVRACAFDLRGDGSLSRAFSWRAWRPWRLGATSRFAR